MDGVPQPVYTINPSDIMIEFTAPEDRIIRSVTRKVTDRLDEKSIQILELISENPAYTSTAMAEKMSVNRKTVYQRLKEMKEKNIIERVGSDRKGYRKIKATKSEKRMLIIEHKADDKHFLWNEALRMLE